MKRPDNLTVEIFRDFHTPGITIDPVLASLDGIAKLANTEFHILRTDRRIKIAAEDKEVIHAKRVNWQALAADMNIILSDRPIESNPDTRIYGQTLVRSGAGIGSRGSLVSTYENDQMTMVASHEICHALNLKSMGNSWDGDHHCTDEHCFMYETVNRVREAKEREPASLREKLRKLARGAITETEVKTHNKTPCAECARQVGFHVSVLQDAKNGKFVPAQFIFPHT